MYVVEYTTLAKEDLDYWKRDPKIVERIEKLIENMKLTPFTGIGKPEPLKHDLSGYWSRRINDRHRIVYKVHKNIIYIAQCRFHY
jgi:toxin YoeB